VIPDTIVANICISMSGTGTSREGVSSVDIAWGRQVMGRPGCSRLCISIVAREVGPHHTEALVQCSWVLITGVLFNIQVVPVWASSQWMWILPKQAYSGRLWFYSERHFGGNLLSIDRIEEPAEALLRMIVLWPQSQESGIESDLIGNIVWLVLHAIATRLLN